MMQTPRVPAQRHRTAREFVYDEVTRAIATGALAPGSRLNEQVLSDWLKVSRTPIREALNALDADSFVEIVPHHGAVVRSMDPQDLRDEYVLRAAYESLAVERSVPRIAEEELTRLGELHEHMSSALTEGEMSLFLSMNREFHLGLYGACDSPRLLSLISSSWDREDVFRRYYYVLDDAESTETHMHQDLLDAYRDRDATRASDLVKHSLLTTGQALADRLSESSTAITAPPTVLHEERKHP